MVNILEKSKKVKSAATKLIQKHNLEKTAKKYFDQVSIVGSYVHNTMVQPDIDIDCFIPKINRRKMLEISEELFQQGFQKIVLYDRTSRNQPYFIINIEDYEFEGMNWIITFFVREKLSPALGYAQEVLKKMTPKKRKIILKIKEIRSKDDKLKRIPSTEIYDQVLEGKVKSAKQFFKT